MKHLLFFPLNSSWCCLVLRVINKPYTSNSFFLLLRTVSFSGYVCMLSRVGLFATPWTAAHQAPLSMRFPRQEYLNGLPFLSPGDLLTLGIKPGSPALAGRFFTTEPPEKITCWRSVCIINHHHLTSRYSVISFSLVQSLNPVWLFVTPWIAARQASLSITNTQSLLKLMPVELVMPSNRLILCHPLLLLPPMAPSIRVFSNESTLRMR